MTDKLCPFDKQPCIRDRCEVFDEDSEACSFLFIGKPRKAVILSKDERTSSKYKAHLFD